MRALGSASSGASSGNGNETAPVSETRAKVQHERRRRLRCARGKETPTRPLFCCGGKCTTPPTRLGKHTTTPTPRGCKRRATTPCDGAHAQHRAKLPADLRCHPRRACCHHRAVSGAVAAAEGTRRALHGGGRQRRGCGELLACKRDSRCEKVRADSGPPRRGQQGGAER